MLLYVCIALVFQMLCFRFAANFGGFLPMVYKALIHVFSFPYCSLSFSFSGLQVL